MQPLLVEVATTICILTVMACLVYLLGVIVVELIERLKNLFRG